MAADDAQIEPNLDGDPTWRAPYVAYTTLVGLLDNKLGTNPLPPRIDRGFLDTYAGSVQAMLLSTLKIMGFVAEDGRVLEPLREATRSPALRKRVIGSWARSFYAEQIKLAEQNATASMLHESFARHKMVGSTLRKAVVFYLALVEDTGLPNSPHFKPPRQTQGASSRPKKRAAPQPATAEVPATSASAGGEHLTVDFGDAGQIRLEVDVRWLQLPLDTFSKLRAALAELESLAQVSPEAQEVSGS